MKRTVIFLFVLLLGAALAYGQELMLTTQGVSPRDVGKDEADIYTAAYSGLLNVGVESQMYLKAVMVGASLTSPVWAVTQAPNGSAAAITETVDVDTSTQVAAFKPDLIGTYVVQVTDGDLSAEVTINAGTYMGIEDGNCVACHADKVTEWQDTGHSSMLMRGLEGTLSDHYGPGCISCHTTGYDVNAANNGFDDRTQSTTGAEPGKLNAIKVDAAPVTDGVVDDLWADVPALDVKLGETSDVHDPSTIKDCANCHAFDSDVHVSLKAVYTDDSIYVMAQWPDPNASFTRGGSWSFANGAWETPNPEQSEDRIAFFWPIGEIKGNPYDTGGCMAKCHTYFPTDEDPHVSTHGIVDDSWLESGKADMWHSKAARGAAYRGAAGTDLTIDPATHQVIDGVFSMLGYADDKWVGPWADDTVNGEDGGRYGDAGTSGYSHNRIGDKSRPQFMEKAPADYADAMFLTQDEIDAGECVGDATTGVTDAEAATYWPLYAALDAVVPERILRQPAGSRGDLLFGAVWKDGMWTAEMSRPLNTNTEDDIQFTDLESEYRFGVAAFENSRHGYEHRTSQMYNLKFVTDAMAGVTPFIFPDELGEGTYQKMLELYPNSMKLANIQCESCHGPASAHMGNTSDSKMVSSLSADPCAVCHDAGTHHVYPEQWDVSQHANPKYAGYAGGRTPCSNCHSGAGFVAYLENGETTPAEAPPVTAITCATCHDPHSADNAHQLRKTEPVTLGDGTVVDKGGNGLLCMNCHKGRRNVVDYTGAGFSYSSHYGPHHGPQADMLAGANAATFGKRLPSSPHLSATEDACVTCHMAPGHVDEENQVIKVGSHSFWVTNPETGEDNVAICADCHGDVGESFAEKKYYYNGVADHDGDGVEEGLQEEVEGLLEKLAKMLPPIDTLDVDVSGKYIYTDTEKKAAFNYLFVEEDRSHGVHNPAFAVALLKVSIKALENNAVEGEIVAIEDVPNDNGKQVLIIWDKLVDDGVAADPIVNYAVKRLDGDTWVTVGEVTADGSPRYALVVPTVWDSTATSDGMTTFMVRGLTRSGEVHNSVPAQGYSVDNLIPMAPTGFMATLSGNEVGLSWDESEDVDFNYFAIYKGTEAGFVPSAENQLATTTGTEFFDAEIEAGNTYYYKIAAYDFSGNESEFAEAEPVVVSGVDSRDKSVPTEFSLAQNYPNPFNPTTEIEFGVPNSEEVTINIYDIRGVHVRTLAQGRFAAGYHTITWDGRDDNGNQVSAGTYLYRLESAAQQFTRKAILLK